MMDYDALVKRARNAQLYTTLHGELCDAIEALVKERDEALALCESLRTHLKMTEKERDEAREALEWAKEATQPIASLVAMTAEGFPDHDICPIRLGQARAIAEAHAAIDAALKETGE